jgi:membrane-associated phospholipid phosphatase
MAATVVISGNHWILDVVGAALTVMGAAGILLIVSWLGGRLSSRRNAIVSMTGGQAT